MIKEAYCSYELSKLLREKGFDEECHMFYCKYTEERLMPIMEIGLVPDNEEVFFAPTHQKALAWLRKRNIYIYVEPFITISSKGYHLEGYKPWVAKMEGNWFNPLHKLGKIVYTSTYEEATEAAIKYSLENLI